MTFVDALVSIATAGTGLLGVAYAVAPETVYGFGFEFLRDGQSEPSEADRWLHRFVGITLVVITGSSLLG